jgi:hypothetical protein
MAAFGYLTSKAAPFPARQEVANWSNYNQNGSQMRQEYFQVLPTRTVSAQQHNTQGKKRWVYYELYFTRSVK